MSKKSGVGTRDLFPCSGVKIPKKETFETFLGEKQTELLKSTEKVLQLYKKEVFVPFVQHRLALEKVMGVVSKTGKYRSLSVLNLAFLDITYKLVAPPIKTALDGYFDGFYFFKDESELDTRFEEYKGYIFLTSRNPITAVSKFLIEEFNLNLYPEELFGFQKGRRERILKVAFSLNLVQFHMLMGAIGFSRKYAERVLLPEFKLRQYYAVEYCHGKVTKLLPPKVVRTYELLKEGE